MPVSSARARFRRRFVELVRDRAEDAVVVEPGLADRDDPRVREPSRRSDPSQRRPPWPRRADGPRPRRRARRSGPRRRAPGPLDATFQPGTRIRSTPASRAAPMTWSASHSKRSALRWQWLSTRRRAAALRSGRLGLDIEAREQGLRCRQPAGFAARAPPRRARRAPMARHCRPARMDTRSRAVPSNRGAVPGRNGAAASPTSRHASIRSPRTPRRRSPAASSPSFAALARTQGCSASTALLASPMYSHKPARASWSRQPSMRSR